MKNVFFSLILTLAAGLGILHAQAPVADQTGNTKVGLGKPLPDFSFTSTSGKPVTKASLPKGQPVIVFYFDPDCDHCQLQSKMINDKIAENKDFFKGITFLFVSWGEMEAIKQFPVKHLPGLTSPNFFTKDEQYKFDSYFGYSEVPSIYVYDRYWVRTGSFKAETKPENLVYLAWK
jgi:hypothetical protein